MMCDSFQVLSREVSIKLSEVNFVHEDLGAVVKKNPHRCIDSFLS